MRKINYALFFIVAFFCFNSITYAADYFHIAQCIYEGTASDGKNTVVTIYASGTPEETKYQFKAHQDNKLKYETVEFEKSILVEQNTSYLGIPILGSIPGTTHYIYFSPTALTKLKNGLCSDYAYYEVNFKDGFCFQNASDGDFCKNKDENFFMLNLVSETPNETPGGGASGGGGVDNPITIEKPDNMCEGIFYKNGVKTEFGRLLAGVLKLIRYAAPLLVLALSSVDFLKAVISQNKDELTKAAKNSTIRLILAILLFFVPVLINYLLILIFGISDPTCGIL